MTRNEGLLSYGTSLAALGSRVLPCDDRLLEGANPADLPVEQPAAVELVINRKTAEELGLTVPQTLLRRADQVIG